MMWNRCDICGRFIALADFHEEGGGAIRRLIYPDSDFTCETYETLCRDHVCYDDRHYAKENESDHNRPYMRKLPKT